jgi:large subunit ribosomal protein L4
MAAEKDDKAAAAAKPKPARARKAKAAKADSGAVPVRNAENKQVSEVTLSPAVFAAKPNPHLIYEAVKQYRAGARRGTHMTKNRALVSGSGRKPWRQKGTGRARVGEIRTPLWRHGGTVFGPVPRDYSYAMPKKARAAALRAALSQRRSEGALTVVDALPVRMPEKPPHRLTQQLKAILSRLEVSGKALIVDHEPTDALLLSGRNLPGVVVLDPSHVSAYDVLDCRHVVLTSEGLSKLEERLG